MGEEVDLHVRVCAVVSGGGRGGEGGGGVGEGGREGGVTDAVFGLVVDSDAEAGVADEL
jgi:hypothetical protein